jgi:hypothetical protein
MVVKAVQKNTTLTDKMKTSSFNLNKAGAEHSRTCSNKRLAVRRQPELKLRNKASKSRWDQWLAGFIDGDGTILVTGRRQH